MAKTQLPMTGGFYESRSQPLSNQMCSNLFVHINEGGGLANEVLFGTPGAALLATSGTTTVSTNRGSHVMDGIAYFVNGTALFRLNQIISGTGEESFTVDNIGGVEGEARVSMADNGTQLCILVPGGKGYIWVEDTSTFTEITDVDFRASGDPQHVKYVDGFFMFTTDEKKFIISALNNGLAYNALDVATAEADPDKIVSLIILNNIPYIAGSETLEPFRNAAAQTGAGFPFVRIEGGVVSVGVFAEFSLIKTVGLFAFIGGGKNDDPKIYTYNGSSIAPISTDAIDDLLEKLTVTQLEAVFAWEYSQGGDHFLGFTLPTTTIVYEFKSKKWHERRSFDIIEDVAEEFRWRANSVVKAYGRILIGDNQDGRVGSIALDVFDEYGQNIISTFSTMPFSNLGNNIKFPFIELTIESGVGNTDDPDPMISMDRSIDGKTFTPRRERSMGKVGEFKKRQIWRRNGNARRFELFRWTVSAKVKKVFIKLEGNIK